MTNKLKLKNSNFLGQISQNPRLKMILTYILLALIAFLMLFPLLWLLSTAFKSPTENIFQFPPQLLPNQPTVENFVTVWQNNPFGRYLLNSTIVAALTVTLNLIFCALAAYPLARLDFRGRDLIFTGVVTTIYDSFSNCDDSALYFNCKFRVKK
jgi:putative chitobiose transport system permease protein